MAVHILLWLILVMLIVCNKFSKATNTVEVIGFNIIIILTTIISYWIFYSLLKWINIIN